MKTFVNPKYERREGEDTYEYGLRLIEIKVEQKPDDLDWEDIVEATGIECHRDSLRKAASVTPYSGYAVAQYFKKKYAAQGNPGQDDYMGELNCKIAEMRKEAKRFYDQRREFNKMVDRMGNVYAVNLIIGALSSIVDNVPLVAGAIGMYPVATDAMVAAATDPAYLANFMQDGVFWQFLAYCAGVGGSMLIIGSAAGVVVMGLERINFIWYLKNISLLALAGYLSGAVVYILQNLIL